MAAEIKFIGPGIVLFLDQSIVAAGNWFYWLTISRIISPSEIGQAIIISSVVVLTSTITQLGLEYPLLRKSATQPHQIVGTTLAIELVISLASVPIIFYVLNNLYGGSLHGFTWIAIGILILSSLSFVSRFALLGVSDAKKVLIIDLAGMVTKFLVGYILILTGFGAYGILISILLQALFTSGAALIMTRKIFSFKIDNIKYVKEIIIDGLVNTPAKLSRTLILSLSVVLLASFGISNSHIGVFYVALMISVVVGGFALSMAYMAIPASTLSRTDLSTSSLRISLNFTAPLISALIVAPTFILSLIGPGYVSAGGILIILSVSILPSAITMNAISKFNNLGEYKKLISIGFLEILVFIIAFYQLVPNLGTTATAFSILIAFGSSSILSTIWLEKASMKYVATSIAAVFIGFMAGYMIKLMPGIHPLLVILTSAVVTIVFLILLKNTTTLEIRYVIKSMMKRR